MTLNTNAFLQALSTVELRDLALAVTHELTYRTKSLGPRKKPSTGTTDPTVTVVAGAGSVAWTPEEVALARNNPIAAIKAIRARTTLGLKEAKDHIDELRAFQGWV
jgi:ribosomal protein L7/L12